MRARARLLLKPRCTAGRLWRARASDTSRSAAHCGAVFKNNGASRAPATADQLSTSRAAWLREWASPEAAISSAQKTTCAARARGTNPTTVSPRFEPERARTPPRAAPHLEKANRRDQVADANAALPHTKGRSAGGRGARRGARSARDRAERSGRARGSHVTPLRHPMLTDSVRICISVCSNGPTRRLFYTPGSRHTLSRQRFLPSASASAVWQTLRRPPPEMIL